MTYHDNKGIVWVKNGADKRKVFDNAELAEMMTDCGSFAPDEAGVRNATVNDLDAMTIKQFLGNRFDRVLEKKGLTGRCVKMHAFFFYAQSPDFHKLGLCYYLKNLYL